MIGDFSGQVSNTTILTGASPSDFAKPDIQNQDTTKGQEGKGGLGRAGDSNLSGNSNSDMSAELVHGQSDNLPRYSGVITPQGVDPGLHVRLPGFSGTGSTSISDILAAITGGQALFKPVDPNVISSSSNLHAISGGGISSGGNSATNVVSNSTINSSVGANNITSNVTEGNGNNHIVTIPNMNTNNSAGVSTGITPNGSFNTVTNANVNNVTVNVPTNNPSANTVITSTVPVDTQYQPGNVNTTPLQPGSNYLIESKPAYTSVTQFYGSQYLLDRLSINGSYMFLGDAGFDSTYIQQQYIQATGQSYPGGTYMTASNAMKTMLNNAADAQSKLGLQFGTALTKEQQAALDEDIVWYVPVVVDGKTVLAPQLYLSPKTDILAGASIKGKNVNITAGSINNSGLMQGTESIALTATNGNISNIGGTIKGGKISLTAQNGSVINSDTVNTYLVNGGTGSYLGSQGQIIGSGSVGIKASDSITTHGGIIQSGSTLAMLADTINIGSVELNAAASSVTHASDGTLAFKGNQTLNYGTTIKAGGNATLQTTKGDLTLAGSNLSAQGSVSLASAGSISLNAVTNSGFSDVKGHKSGAFNHSSFQNTNAYTNEVGSNITSGGQLDVVAKKDVTIAGGLTAKNDVNIVAKDGGITENALKSTSDSYKYHHTSKTGFWGSETGLSAQVGTKKSTTKNSESSVTHTGSIIASTSGSVNMSANNGDININGSSVLAKQDINMSGDNINFNTVQNISKGDHYNKQSFTGLSVTASGLIGDAAKTGFFVANATDSNMQTLNAASMAYSGLNAGLGKAGFLGKGGSKGVDYTLIGASATIGHSSNKSSSNTVTTTDIGSTVSAGGKVNITAKNDINAKASNISGNDVIFNAGGDVNLTAGQKIRESKTTSSNNSFGVGATASLGAKGGSFGLTGNVAVGFGNSKSSSTTAIDTTVNGTNSVVINNKNGNLNINGAQITNKTTDGTVSDGSITINTGNLNITTPQNTAKYDSDQITVGINASTPIGGGFGWADSKNAPEVPYSNGSPFGQYQNMSNNYKSTEQTLSGLYAGKGGLAVNVSGTTTLTGGAITSTADADKNQITTGSLIANSLDNHSEWSGLNVTGTESLSNKHGIGVIGKDNGQEVMGIPGNVLGKASTGVTGNSVSHDEHTVTNSVIGGNITVNAGSTTGTLSRDPDTANGYIKDQFDPNKINSNFALQNQATRIMSNYAELAINAIATANNKAEQTEKDNLHTTINTATQNDKELNKELNNSVNNDDFSLINKGNVSALAGGLSAIGGAIIGGGNVGTTTAGVAGGLAGNALYNEAFPTDRPLGQDKNPLDISKSNINTEKKEEFAQDKTSNSSQQQTQNTNNENVKYDDQTDLNKIGSSLIKNGIVGGLGALAGILTGGNIAIDTTTGGLTGLTIKAPSLKKKADPKATDNKNKTTPTSTGDKK